MKEAIKILGCFVCAEKCMSCVCFILMNSFDKGGEQRILARTGYPKKRHERARKGVLILQYP